MFPRPAFTSAHPRRRGQTGVRCRTGSAAAPTGVVKFTRSSRPSRYVTLTPNTCAV
ncbi:MAG: hypothetical protein LBU32_04240 [Clostridiales bacterium]|nr:hypothetical protein [Clostridiales bacterium]